MSMYLILDKISGPQRFPLSKLLRMVNEVANNGKNAIWKLIKVRGYGAEVCKLEDEIINKNEDILVTSDEIIKISDDPDQWFYDLDCCDENKRINFGVLDSGALFIKGEDQELIDNILEGFKKVIKCQDP